MRTIFFVMLQVILASGILYGYYHLMLRNKKFHQYNRFSLLASVVISVLIPLLNIPVYFEKTEIQSSFVLQTLQTISSTGIENEGAIIPAIPYKVSSPFDWNMALYLFYGLVVLLLFIRILISLKRITWVIKNNPVEELDGVHFINTLEPGTPYSFFRWLFWNKKIELRSEKGEQIFRHEVFHIQQRHSVDVVFMELLTVVFWINPFFHLMKKEIKAIHEFLADQFAAHKTEKWEYAELLLMEALNTHQHLVNPFFHNQIKRRIAMITNPKKTSHRYLRKLLVLPVAAIVVILFAFKLKHKEADAAINAVDPITIVVDAAHGGTDPGVESPDKKYSEAQIALEISRQIQQLAKEYNVNVVMTREDDKFPGNAASKEDGLKKRIEITNRVKPDAFVAIHVNFLDNAANKQVLYSGFEAYVSEKKKDVNDRLLASAVLSNLSSVYKTSSELKKGKNPGIYVLDHNSYPAVLLECGYINNPEDLAFITDRSNQEKIARSILTAIVKYKSAIGSTTGISNPAPIAIDGTFDIEPLDSVNSEKPSKIIINGKKFNIKEVRVEGMENSKIVAADFHLSNWTTGSDTSRPLIVIDGVKQEKNSSLANIDPASIESVNVWKGETAITMYGPDGKNGVIEIFTKKKNDPAIKEIVVEGKPIDPGNKIFDKVEIEPAFPGGYDAWRKFLERNLNSTIPIQNHAPFGKYTVYIEFVVNTDGSISNVRPLTNHGFGMEQEAARVIKEGPSWLPAIQNGHKVNAFRKQPVTFEIANGENYDVTVMGHKISDKKDVQAEKKTSKDLNEVVVVGFSSPVAEKVEIEASFPGGEAAWNQFLKRNLDASIPEKNNAGQGEYTVWIQFIVHTDGSVTEIKPLTNHGFGMELEAMRIIRKGPRWVPAMQNGQKVNAYKKQRVDFVVGHTKKITKDLPLEKVRTIEQDKTSLSRVQSLFGEPASRSIENNFISWIYETSNSRLIIQFNRADETVMNFKFSVLTRPKRENIDYEKAKMIKENQTTFTEVEKLFGQPYQIEINNNDEYWTYEGFYSRLNLMSANRKNGIINSFKYNN